MVQKISKEMVDSAIKKSSDLEGLLTIIVSSIIGGLIGNLITRKEDKEVM